MLKKVCLYAGPGAGKSTTAAGLFYKLKVLGFNTEYISEYIKAWSYEGRVPKSFQQFYIFAKQLNREDVVLSHVDFIVTDSPILMNVAYSKKYDFPGWKQQLEIAMMHEERFPGLHIFLDRTDIKYQQVGRYEDEEAAWKMDEMIEDLLKEYIPNYTKIPARDNDLILANVLNNFKYQMKTP